MSLGILRVIVVATKLAILCPFLAELLATLAELAAEPAAKPTREIARVRRGHMTTSAMVSEVARFAIAPMITFFKPGWSTQAWPFATNAQFAAESMHAQIWLATRYHTKLLGLPVSK